MKARLIALSLPFLALALPAAADILHLKDGTTVEGSILREEGDSYVVLVNVTKTIKDERVIAKADVTRISREKVDLTAFVEVEKLMPVPDLATAEEYKRRIKLVEKFLAEHRGSSKTRQAREMLAALTAESAKIAEGGIKISGKIMPPAEYRANAYEIDARVMENTIRTQIKEGRFLEGLRSFLAFERDFRNTRSFGELLPLIQQVITNYSKSVEETLGTLDARLKERELGLGRMSNADRNATQRAIDEETAALDARFKAEKEAKVGWVTTHPYSKASLEDALNFARSETSRLKALPVATVDSGKVYRDSLDTILNNGDATAVSAAISSARSAMLPAKYIEILESAASAAAAAQPAGN